MLHCCFVVSQALCELLTKAGKKLEASTKSKAKFDATFANLDKLSKHKKLAPRMKFLIRDVIDLRKSSWIPRRDVLQVCLAQWPILASVLDHFSRQSSLSQVDRPSLNATRPEQSLRAASSSFNQLVDEPSSTLSTN